jgi:hypothetical protein
MVPDGVDSRRRPAMVALDGPPTMPRRGIGRNDPLRRRRGAPQPQRTAFAHSPRRGNPATLRAAFSTHPPASAKVRSALRTCALLAVGSVLAACGSTTLAIDRPSRPIWVCLLSTPRREGCRDRFDARRLLGLSLPAAQRIARRRGYSVRRVKPLGPKEAVTMDLRYGRLDIETNAPTESSTVIRFVEQG